MDRELALLGLLRQENAHGYQLHEMINQYLEFCTDIKRPTAYALLDKLTDAGLIEVHHEEQLGRRPKRRVYRVTAAGEARFQQLLRESLSSYTPVRFSDDIGIAFMDALSSEEAMLLLRQRRNSLAQYLNSIKDTQHPGGKAMNLVLEHYRWHLQSELDWLDHLLQTR